MQLNSWTGSKNLDRQQTFCATPKYNFISAKFGFCASAKVFEEALNAIKFLDWLKKFGPAQNILGPVEGQGIIVYYIDNRDDVE